MQPLAQVSLPACSPRSRLWRRNNVLNLSMLHLIALGRDIRSRSVSWVSFPIASNLVASRRLLSRKKSASCLGEVTCG
jgi:hypothetical protein